MSDDEQKQQFAMMIADIIQDLLQDSDELSEILEAASDDGYDIFLTVFSGIMIRRRGKGEDEEAENERGPLPIKFEFTEMDKEFLQSIGVQVPPEEEDQDDSSAPSDVEA